jgi:hypothetical protein
MKFQKLTRGDSLPVYLSPSGSVQSAKDEGGPPGTKTRVFLAGELHFVREDVATVVTILSEL